MKKIFPILVICCLSLSNLAYSQSQKLSLDTLPSLFLLENFALEYAGIHPKKMQELYKKSKWAAALPKLQIGFDQNSQNNSTAVIQDSLSVTSSGVTIGPESNRIDQDNNRKFAFEAKAVWYLDALVFNQDTLLVSREARDQYLVRQRILSELHQAYFDLKSLLIAASVSPESTSPLDLRIEKLVAKLNSLTGGQFSFLVQEELP